MQKILIIEDDASIMKLIQTTLTQTGYECMCACDGKQGADIFETGHLIIIWIILPPYILQKYRENAFCSEVTVLREDIYPYKADYADPKNKLDKAVRVLKYTTGLKIETLKEKDMVGGKNEELLQGTELLRGFLEKAFGKAFL